MKKQTKNNMENGKIMWPVLMIIVAIGAFLGWQYYGGGYTSVDEKIDISENYALKVEIAGQGNVLRDKEGNDYMGEAQIYENGTDVFLTPFPKEGYYFESWSGCDGVYVANNMCWVSMDSSKSVAAIFKHQ